MFELLNLYDERFDILDLKIDEDYKYNYSIEADSSLILDIDTGKRLVAFEILDATSYFNLDKKLFYQTDYCILVNVTEDVIKIKLQLNTSEGSFEYNLKVINNADVMPGDYKYGNGYS